MSRATLRLAKQQGRDPQLVDLESHITNALTAFVDAGEALAQIRTDRLYESDGHATFEDYCAARWNFTPRRANQLIAAASTMRQLEYGNNCSRLPENEAQVRELAKLPEADRPGTWVEVIETAPDGKVTAKHVAAVVAKRRIQEESREAYEAIRRGETVLTPAAPEPETPEADDTVMRTCCECGLSTRVAGVFRRARSVLCRGCIDNGDFENLKDEVFDAIEFAVGNGEMLARLADMLRGALERIEAAAPKSSPTVADLENLTAQRAADPDYRATRQTQAVISAAIPPTRGQRMIDFVLDGGELALLRLGLDWTVTADSLKAAYRDAARQAHPDRGGSAEDFRKVTEARDLIAKMLGAT